MWPVRMTDGGILTIIQVVNYFRWLIILNFSEDITEERSHSS